MPLESKVRRRLLQTLGEVDERHTEGPRLIDDAARLWNLCQKFIGANQINAESVDRDALELACFALQLPQRQAKPPTAGKMGRSNLKDRAEQAAELLVSLFDKDIEEALLDRASRVLHEMPHKLPAPEESRLLADVVNLDEFGLIGLIMQCLQLSRQGDGVNQLAEGCEKRDQYGYWDARLKDGFHFEPIRQIARRRLAHARSAAKMLLDELSEDQP
jgi:hypothetical protein